MIGNIGMGELLLIFLVVLLVFGAKRIPEIARGLGRGLREFKEATREISNELNMDAGYRQNNLRSPSQAAPVPRPVSYEAQRTEAHPGASNPAPAPAPGPVSKTLDEPVL